MSFIVSGNSWEIFVSRQLKNFNKAKFLEDLERIYWDDLVDHDEPRSPKIFVSRQLKNFNKAKFLEDLESLLG